MATAANLKQQAHEMIERMAPSQVSAVVALLEVMLDPFSRALANAPMEDELVGDDEAHTVAASHQWLQHQAAIPNREVLAEFGLSEEDFERMAQTPLPAER
jgi:hypothetical protein